jgi:hypothetical protein
MSNKFKLEDLNKLKRDELYQIAQELKIKGRSKLTKSQLIEALTPFAENSKNKKSLSDDVPAKKGKPGISTSKNAKITPDTKTDTKKTVSEKSDLNKKDKKSSGKKIASVSKSKKTEVATKPARIAADDSENLSGKKSESAKKKTTKKPAKTTAKSKKAGKTNGSTEKKSVAKPESAAEKTLDRSFAKQKKADDGRKKTGATVKPVAIPVELPASRPTAPSLKAEQIEAERSKRHSSLKTTMEIPVFSAPSIEAATPITEDDLTGDLPADYGETRIVVQVRDPHWAHAYWQIPRSELKRLELDVGIFEFAHSHFVLRVHNVSDGYTQEFRLSDNARSHYFYLEKADTVYQAELGLQSPTEGYSFIALSNLIQTPPDRVASSWAAPVKQDPVEGRIAGHEIPAAKSEPVSTAETQPVYPEITDPQIVYGRSVSGNDMPACMPSQSGAGMVSGPAPTEQPGNEVSPWEGESLLSFNMPDSWNPSSESSGSFSTAIEKSEPKTAFLTTTAEMVLYGSVQNECLLSFNGHPVKVGPDGGYSLRLQLPVNQNNEIELEAQNPETGEKKTIRASIRFDVD